ncbi:nucleotide exchange factor GrpE [Streptomyces hyaluromycini]|uniref:nucleotide exchange factor GrpE n=1 Tax=Streptomyces hyaluromycini TaxID=1377993 RepID=UPI0011AE6B39|nr:nucleotide exchange factor GrpE [Streptomyces hyaluromycini]
MFDIVLCVGGALVGFWAGYLARGPRAPVRDGLAPAAGEPPTAESAVTPEPPVSPPPPPPPPPPPDSRVSPEPRRPESAERLEGAERSESADRPAGSDAPAGRSAPGDALRTAAEVLDVADLVTNPELSRRLAEAVVLLPGVVAIRPLPGDAFEPLKHEWVGSRATDDSSRWDTVAEVRSPGASASGRLLRAAYVVVFEPPEES